MVPSYPEIINHLFVSPSEKVWGAQYGFSIIEGINGQPESLFSSST